MRGFPTSLATLALVASTFVQAQPGLPELPEVLPEQQYVNKVRYEDYVRATFFDDIPADAAKLKARSFGNYRSHKHSHVHKPSQVKKRADNAISAPQVVSTQYLGPSTNQPSSFYFSVQDSCSTPSLTLGTFPAKVELDIGSALANNYPMCAGVGSMTVSITASC